jgi:hypothetical protein
MLKFIFISGFTILLTSAATAQVTLLQTDFEAGIPSTYTMINYDGLTPAPVVSTYIDAWNAVINPTDPTDTVAGSTSYFSPVGRADRWLITPQLTLGTFGNYLTWEARSQDASYPDDYLVLLSTTGIEKADFKDTIGNLQGEYASWTSRSISLSDKGFNDSTVYLAFVNRTNNGFKLYLDDILVTKNDPLAVHTMVEDPIRIYPNPTSGLVHVDAKDFVSVTILNLNGQVIRVNDEVQHVDLSDLTPGMYLLQVKTSKGVFCKSVSKR